MYLLVVILDRTANVERVLNGLREIGITGVTMFDSVGLGRNTMQGASIPMVAGMGHIGNLEGKTYNHTIVSVIDSRTAVEKAMAVAQEVCGDFGKPDVGIMFSLKLDQVVGYDRTPE